MSHRLPASPPGDAIRSFVAFDIDPAVRTALRALQTAFLDTHADVRWVRAEGLHVTLKFLGAVEPARLEAVHTALVAALVDQPPLRLTVRGLGAFPAWHRARVVWVGLAGEGLIELAACAERTLTGLGFPAEGRPFTPHLTIGRVNSPRGWPRLEELIMARLQDNFGDSCVDAVTIYRSTLQPGGAVYTSLWTIPLGGHKGEPHDIGC
jgi:RNA 2',3'-cyclic 3'-phosphodiesterase